ncbi:MAG TPA: hypothetical protein VGG64_13110 [Pirellulales bacterium]|jgi:hypothetical protein
MAESTPKPRRRWFQFRLGAMLFAVTLLGVLAWGAGEHRERKRLEEVVRAQRVDIQRRQLLSYPPQRR